MFKKLAAFVTALTLLGSLFFIGSPLAFALSPTDTIVIEGHGWGHAVGMCQYGAKGMAEAGFTYDRILAHYYQGTTLEAGSVPATIKIGLLTKQSEISVTGTGNFNIYAGSDIIATGSAEQVWKVRLSGTQYQVIKPDETPLGTYAYPIKFVPASGLIKLPQKTTYNRFRGSMIVQSLTDGLAAINELSFDKYLYGVVPSEMPSSWHPEALKAQACAARNYAFKNIGKHDNYDLCATTHCQVYLGYDHERESTNAAVDATAGKLIMNSDGPITAYYHSTCGGSTENSENVWSTPRDYCKAATCPYCTASKYRNWSVTYTVSEIQAKLNANDATKVPGTLIGLEITSLRGPRRVGYVKIVGTDGEVEVSGSKFQSVLGLRSTWFTISRIPRLAGLNRYSTSCAISTKGWETSNAVVIARGDLFPDALAGAALAYKNSCPILLTESATLTAETEAEIKRLGATRAIILGGTGAISSTVEQKLSQLGLSVTRISGEDRYDTAAKIALKVGSPSQTAIIATGENFADALAISSYSAENQKPILLTLKDSLPNETDNVLSSLGIKSVVIVGGTGAVSQTVQDALIAMGITVTRIGGTDRYDTAYKIANQYFSAPVNVYITRGDLFPDALSAAPLAAKNSAPLLLVKPGELPLGIKSYLEAKSAFISGPYIIGGSGAVSSAVDNEIANALGI
ncbi:SpoIID/LytB domain-containing protein [Candidatus Oleimmundimicrobium sp.]|uniref:SpoIID/LytB domain-containing protein n=1 Tax=Candidatus Oleimmundimicrobium sp. TaxID=3060597 RepID=UPI0027173EB5|nr:SpoIID/LytB domain-containing protein [Candidatus Oleimmundimicrobium sp.]MDO8885558.1 SpoIID/LytB domain-containing protein [Candidatus Oleimmundimicrobium sp.]